MLLEVKLWGKTVGALYFDTESNKVVFQYDTDFVDSNLAISPIIMPLVKNKEYIFSDTATFKNLPPVFSDSLPDKFGNTILNTWLETQGKTINELNPLEKLSYIGTRGMGALEYFPNKDFVKQTKTLDIPSIVQIADEVLNQKKEQQNTIKRIENILQISSSTGGARAKAIIAINEKTNEIFSGDVIIQNPNITYYILKIDLNTPIENYAKIEYVYYQMAVLAKINMMPSRLYEENGNTHFLTQRFDRVNGEKIHMQTLCAMAKMDFNQPLQNSYEQAFKVLMILNLDFADTLQLYKLMLFNVLSRNVDDHTKNISFLMNKQGVWKLSPAYDLTYTFSTNGHWGKRHEMSVNGKRKNITYKDLLDVGAQLKIRNRKTILKEVASAVSNWSSLAKKAGIPEQTIKTIDKNLRYHTVLKELF